MLTKVVSDYNVKKDVFMNMERNNKIEEILSSLDGTKRAGVPDFFYTRLTARLTKGIDEKSKPAWILRPVYIVAALLLILAINAIVFLNNRNEAVVADDNDTVQQSIAAEYNLNDTNSMYDLNQDK